MRFLKSCHFILTYPYKPKKEKYFINSVLKIFGL